MSKHDFITVLKSKKPCNKRVELTDEGELVKTPAAPIYSAKAQTVHIPDLNAMEQALTKISKAKNQTLILGYVPGTFNGDQFQLVSEQKLAKLLGLNAGASPPPGFHEINGKRYITRTKQNFHPSSWTVFDYDRVTGMPSELDYRQPNQWITHLKALVPGLSHAGYILTPSTTSRVLQDGQPAFQNGGWHIYVQTKDAADLNRYGPHLLVHAMGTEYGFMRPIHSKSTGEVISRRMWSIFDPCTFSCERLVFDGAPVLVGKQLSLAPSNIQKVDGDRLDTSLVEATDEAIETACSRTGYSIGRKTDGKQCQFMLVNSGDLKLDTLIQTHKGPMTVSNYWLSDHGKLRAQAVFRPESKSQAAYLARHQDGSPFLFDVGPQIKYVLSKDDIQDQRLAIALAYVKNETNNTALARGWADYCEFLDHIGTDQVLKAVEKKTNCGKRPLNKTLSMARKKWVEKKARLEQKRTREEVEAQGRTQLQWDVDDAPALVSKALSWIRDDVDHGLVLNYGGVTVEIVRGHPTSIRRLLAKAATGDTYPDQELIAPMTINSAALRALKSIQFLSQSHGKEGQPVDCPPKVSRALVEQPHSFRALTGLLEAPTFQPKGTPIIKPGYDASTGFYATFPPELGQAIPDKATRNDALASLQYLKEVFFADFPFESDLDEAVAVAMLLTAFVGRFLPRMPGFMATAGTQQTGKSTLINIVCLTAYGRPAGAAGWTDDQAEMRKVLISLLMEGQSSVCFDNLPFGARVDGDELSKLITEEVYEGRILGGNTTLKAPANILVLLTGNQLSPINDMISRLLTIRMNAEMEDPSKRQFQRINIEQWVEDHRADIIGHVATIFRAWHQHGKATFNCSRRTRFAEWDEVIRFPLMWLDLQDVAYSFDVNRAEDPYRTLEANLFDTWHDEFGSAPMTASELIQACSCGQELLDYNLNPPTRSWAAAVADLFNGTIPDVRHFGNRLRVMNGKVIGDLKLEKMKQSERSKKSARWRVISLAALGKERT